MGDSPFSAELCINDDGPSTCILKLLVGTQVYYNAAFPWNGSTGMLTGQTLAGVGTNVTITLALSGSGTGIVVGVNGTAIGYGAGTLTGSVTVSGSQDTCISDA